MYIEAVVSNIKQDGRNESTRKLDDILEMVTPPYLQTNFYEQLDESIVRHSNAILSKNKKYLNEYSKLDYIDNEAPYLIALSGYDQVKYGNQFYYPMMALLYGNYYDKETDSYEKKDFILKPNTNSEIPIGIFNNSDMEHISAIIFSCTVTLGKLTSLSISQSKSLLKTNIVMIVRHDQDAPHYKLQEVSDEHPEYLSDGVFIFHNPNAKNKIPLNLFDSTNVINITKSEHGFSYQGNNLPIVSRLNMVKHLLPDKETFFKETFLNYNPNYRMSNYKVLEIDLNIIPNEITLKDQESNMTVTVDLFGGDIDLLIENNVIENDLVFAIIEAKPNEFGNTVQWILHSIGKANTK